MFIIIFISRTLSWCQISGKIQKNFTVIELIYIHTAFQEAFQEDLKYSDFFRDHLPQQIRDAKKSVYFFMDLKKVVLNQVTLGPAQQELNKVGK